MRLHFYKVKVHLKGGNTLNFHARDLSSVQDNNRLTKLVWTGVSPQPLYTRLDDISAIECKHVLNWRRLFL